MNHWKHMTKRINARARTLDMIDSMKASAQDRTEGGCSLSSAGAKTEANVPMRFTHDRCAERLAVRTCPAEFIKQLREAAQ